MRFVLLFMSVCCCVLMCGCSTGYVDVTPVIVVTACVYVADVGVYVYVAGIC